VIVLCLGENSYTEKPGDLQDMTLSALQLELAERLAATGKPVVLVLTGGRPRVISRIESKMRAVVQTYLPGNSGGDALAAILYGEINPSGRLPYTYPRYPNALTGYIHKYSDEQRKAQGAYDYEADYNPQYPFGHGLSYTSFSFTDLKLAADTITRQGQLTATVTVTNTGARPGKTAVLAYVSDLQASLIAPDIKRLRAFEKLSLEPGERKTFTFNIKAQDLAYAGPDGSPVLEPGEYSLQIGDQAVGFCIGD
jgi:beta-glucosidase